MALHSGWGLAGEDNRFPYFGTFDTRQKQFDELKHAVPPIESWGDTQRISAIELDGRLFIRALGDRPGKIKLRLHVYVPK
jgi:hypothetical protein